tara:strand:+ start:1704 stop:2525 length:822 start_codon:yes stop_codon:yes gene_type:complete
LKRIISIKTIAHKYDYFLFDQWGVLHNGYKVFEDAIDCLQELKNLNKKNILISNSSNLTKFSIKGLRSLGIEDELYDYSITSGEIAYRYFEKEIFNKYGNKCFPLSLSKEKIKMFDLNVTKDIKKSNFVLIADIKKGSNIFDFIENLKKMLSFELPLVCTNPDFQVDNNNKIQMCGGTIAQLYEDMGGKVHRYGKPYNPIYMNIIKKFNIKDPKKVLAIGDSFNHDILGASNQGFDSNWIENGIHRSEAKDQKKLDWYFSHFKPNYCQFMLKF